MKCVPVKRKHKISKPGLVVSVTKSETEICTQFRNSMKNDNKKRKKLNAPIAKYDIATKSPSYEYSDGRIVYANEF